MAADLYYYTYHESHRLSDTVTYRMQTDSGVIHLQEHNSTHSIDVVYQQYSDVLSVVCMSVLSEECLCVVNRQLDVLQELEDRILQT